MIERISVAYPKTAAVKDIEFYIDGRYKAVYTDAENIDKSVAEFVYNADLAAELYIMIGLTEKLSQAENGDQGLPQPYNRFGNGR